MRWLDRGAARRGRFADALFAGACPGGANTALEVAAAWLQAENIGLPLAQAVAEDARITAALRALGNRDDT